MRWLTFFLLPLMGCGSAAQPDAGDVFDRIQQATLSSTQGVFEATCGGSTPSYFRLDFTTRELDFEDCQPPLARGQFELDVQRVERLRTALRAIEVRRCA